MNMIRGIEIGKAEEERRKRKQIEGLLAEKIKQKEEEAHLKEAKDAFKRDKKGRKRKNK